MSIRLQGRPATLDRFREAWSNIVGGMREPGTMWWLSVEIMAMGDQLPEVRDQLARAQREGGRGPASLMMGVPEEEVSDETADTLGRFYMTLMSGLIAAWTFDPKTAPDGDALTEGLRQIVEAANRS